MPDTIYALASAPGRSGVSVVRVSGKDVPELLIKITGKLPKPRYATYCRLYTAEGALLDNALVLYFKAPASYTGEDVAEFHIHGSPSVQRDLFTLLERYSVRLAQPGEFTRRSVLNNKMDLMQVEGLKALLEAETTAQREQAILHMDGTFAAELQYLFKKLQTLLAYVEVHLDFPEDDLPANLALDIRFQAQNLIDYIDSLGKTFQRSQILHKGVRVALIGAPNVGKSSLMNYLAQRSVSIVTDIAGTTRDVTEARIVLEGIPITLYDTAGIRQTDDLLETLGIDRTFAAIDEADAVVFLMDDNWQKQMSLLVQIKREPRLCVVNKIDRKKTSFPSEWLGISVLEHQNLDAFIKALTELIKPLIGDTRAPMLLTQRQLSVLLNVSNHLNHIQDIQELEFIAEEVRLALRAYASLYGQIDNEAVLTIIFNDFCIGK